MAEENIINLIINARGDALRKLEVLDKKLDAFTKGLGLNQKETSKLTKVQEQLNEQLKKEIELTEAATEIGNKRSQQILEANEARKENNKLLEEEKKRLKELDAEMARYEKRVKQASAELVATKGSEKEFYDLVNKLEKETDQNRQRLHEHRMWFLNSEAGAEKRYTEALRAEERKRLGIEMAAARERQKAAGLSNRRVGTGERTSLGEKIEVKVDTSQLDRAKAKIRSFQNVYSRFKLELNKVQAAAEDNDTMFGRLIQTQEEGSQAARRLENRLGRLGRAMMGLGIATVLIFMQSFASSLVAVGGHAVALAGSLTYAAGVIGGTFTAAIAQAIPMLGVFGAALQRLSVIQDAIGQFDLIEKQNFGTGGEAEQAAVDNSDAITDAAKQQEEAQKNLTKARADARRELEDLIAAEREAELALRGALLTQEDAERAYQESIRSGDITGFDRADLERDEAKEGVTSARTGLRRARQDAQDARSGGVENMDRVVDATNAVRDANEALADAHEQAATAAIEQSAAESSLDYYLSQLSDTELKLYHRIIDFRERLKQEFAPISDTILGSFIEGIDDAEKLVFNNKILEGMQKLANGMADSFGRLTDLLTNARSINFWTGTLKDGRSNLDALTVIASNLWRIFRNIAEGAAPVLHRFLKQLADTTRDWVDATSDTKSVTDFFFEGLRHLRAWYRLLVGVVDLWGALMGVSSDSAIEGLRDFTDRLHDAADAIRDNRKEAEDFFEKSGKTFGYLIDIVVGLGKALYDAFEPKAVKALRDILVEVIFPALSTAIQMTGQLAIWLDRALQIPMAAEILKWALAFKIVWGTATLLGSLVATVFSPIRTAIGFIITRLMVLSELFGGGGSLLSGLRILAGGTGIGLLIGAVVFLLHKLGVLDDIVNWIGDRFSDLAQIIWSNIGPEIKRLGESFGGLVGTLMDGVDKLVVIFKAAFAGKGGGAGAAIRTFAKIIKVAFEFIWGIVKGAVHAVSGILGGFIRSISGFIEVIDGLIKGDFDQVWNGIKNIVGGAFDAALSVVEGFIEPFKSAGKAIGDAFGDAFEWSINAVVDVVEFVLDKAMGAVTTMLNAAAEVADFVPGLDETALRNAADEIDESREDLRKDPIAAVPEEESIKNSADAIDGWASSVSKAQKENRKLTKEHEALNKILNPAIRNVRDLTEGIEDSTKASDKGGKQSKEFSGKLGILKGSFFGTAKQSTELGRIVRDVANNALKEFGAKELKFTVPEPKSIMDKVSGLFQTGGYFGHPGERGADDKTIRVAGGEAILTGFQQQAANQAFAVSKMIGATPYGSLGELFDKDKRAHAAAPRHQNGGITKRAFGKGGSVPSGGFPDVWGADPGVDAIAYWAAQNFGVTATSGRTNHSQYTASGNISDHWTGNAVDLAGANMGALAQTLAKMSGAQIGTYEGGGPISQLLWQVPDHYDHVHVALIDQFADNAAATWNWLGGGKLPKGFSASVGTSSGAAMPTPQMKKIKVKGPDGPLKDILQGQADRLQKEGNKHLTKKLGSLGGGSVGYMSGGGGAVVNQMGQILLGQGFSPAGAAGIIGNAYRESLWDPSSVGTGGGGLFGFTTSPVSLADLQAFAQSQKKPWDDVGVQMQFMLGSPKGGGLVTDDYYNDLESFLKSTNDVHDATYRFMSEWERPGIPAFEDRLSGAQQALQILNGLSGGGTKRKGKQNGGFAEFDEGGIVPGPRGSRQIVVAHGGETIVPTHKDSFQSGGQVQTTGAKWVPKLTNQNFPYSGLNKGMRQANEMYYDEFRELKELENDKISQISGALEEILREGGPLDIIGIELEKAVADMARRVNEWTYRVKRGIVAQVRTNIKISEKNLKNLEKVSGELEDQADKIADLMKETKKAIGNAEDEKEKDKLKTALNNLRDRSDELTDQITDNLVQRLDMQNQIFENAMARFDQKLGLSDARRRIAELRGEISGDVDEDAIARTYKRTGNILRDERRDIERELRRAKRSGDTERMRELKQALLDNKIAILENTIAIKEHEGAINKIIDFNSTPWELYRQALYDGMGGLLPHNKIPQLNGGGLITRTGIAEVHKDEIVAPIDKIGGDTIVQITEPMEVADPTALASAIGWQLQKAK